MFKLQMIVPVAVFTVIIFFLEVLSLCPAPGIKVPAQAEVSRKDKGWKTEEQSYEKREGVCGRIPDVRDRSHRVKSIGHREKGSGTSVRMSLLERRE